MEIKNMTTEELQKRKKELDKILFESINSGKEANELEIEEQTIDIGIKEDEKETEPAEGKEETFDIGEKDLVKIIHSTLQEQLDESAEKISKELKEDISDNFKRMTGKVI